MIRNFPDDPARGRSLLASINKDGNEPEPVWGRGTVEEHSMHRIYVTKVGSFGLLPLMLPGGVIAIALLVFLFETENCVPQFNPRLPLTAQAA